MRLKKSEFDSITNMKEELENSIFKNFPLLCLEIKNRKWGGLEIGNGWYSLFFNMCRDIDHLPGTVAEKESIGLLQVKQKFGELRVYFSVENEKKFPDTRRKVDKIIEKYVEYSRLTCEKCGKPIAIQQKYGRPWGSDCNVCYKKKLNDFGEKNKFK